MPFTFSHPAIVLPLKKITGKALSLTGLVIGSITPDFEYFIRMKIQSIYSHTIFGLFWFDLPLGLLLTFIFHVIVRNPLINNLPELLNSKLSRFKRFNWVYYFRINWIAVTISILIGAASHILWDDFTHPKGYFVKRISFLKREVFFGKIHLHLYEVFQHLSSLTGGLVVILLLFSLHSDGTLQTAPKSKYWLSVCLFTLLISSIRIAIGLNFHHYGNIIVTLISAFLLSLILVPSISFLLRRPLIADI